MAKQRSNGTVNSASGVCWNLKDLYKSPKDPALEADLAKAEKRAIAFEKKYKGALKRGMTVRIDSLTIRSHARGTPCSSRS